MLKVIIFDIDGVITNLDHFHFIAWKSTFSFYGASINQKQWLEVKGSPRVMIAKKLAILNHLKLDQSTIEEIATKKNELFIHLIKNGLNNSYVLNGIKELIKEAKKRDLKLAVASMSANAKLEIDKLGLANYFDYITDMHSPSFKSLVEKERTSVSPVGLVLQYFKVTGNECIGLEDQVAGIKEYNTYGIFSVGITNYNEEIKNISKYWIELPEQAKLEEIIFNYYQHEKGSDLN